MGKMSEITKIGPDRCMMMKPEEGRPERLWLGRFARGSEQIRILLAGGWVIVEDPRNHLTVDYGQGSKGNHTSLEGDISEPIGVQQRRRPGRPKKS